MKHIQEFSFKGFLQGASHGLPMALGGGVIGCLFSILAMEKGMSLSHTIIMSTLVFSGSVQMVFLKYYDSLATTIVPLLLAILCLNLRHVLMGATLYPWLNQLPKKKLYASAFFMTDETWSLAVNHFKSGGYDGGFFIGCGIVFYCLWLIGSFIGAYFCPQFMLSLTGLSFASVALFLCIAILNIQSEPLWRNILVSTFVSIVAWFLIPGVWSILIGGFMGAMIQEKKHAS